MRNTCQAADPILEGPTLRILDRIIQEERLQIAWAKEWLEKQVENDSTAREQAEQWRRRYYPSFGQPD